MPRLLGVLLLLVLLCPIGARAGAGSDPCLDVANNLSACVAKTDSLGNAKARAQVLGGFRTSLGLQFHPHCFSISNMHGISRKAAEDRLEAMTRQMFSQILGGCRSRYPELDDYLQEWVRQARRTVVTCTTNSAKEAGWRGVNAPVSVGLDFTLEKEAVVGIDLPKGALSSLPHAHKSTVALSREVWLQFFENHGPDLRSARTLMHEIFHSTKANSRFDHNDVASLNNTGKNQCSDGAVNDRVQTIAILCTGDMSLTGYRPAAAVISEKINQCGRQKGCEETFTAEFDGIEGLIARSYDLSKGLPPQKARALCDRIHMAGQCDRGRRKWNSPEELSALMRTYPEFARIANRVRSRLDELLPTASNRVPTKLLEAFPSIQNGLLSVSATRCFESVFEPVIRTDQSARFGNKISFYWFQPKSSLRRLTSESMEFRSWPEALNSQTQS